MSEPENLTKHTGINRRGFLKGVSGALGGATLAPHILSSAHAQVLQTREGIRHLAADGAAVVLKVNGKEYPAKVKPSDTLLEVLREQLDLTGSKEVCGRGACGACTVLLDGRSVNSCLMLAVDAVGKEVTTVEGLAKGGQLDPVQEAYAEHDACQCGYCIPGFVVRSKAFLSEVPNPSLEDIKEGLSGNICRCGTYVRIFDAVKAAAKGGRL